MSCYGDDLQICWLPVTTTLAHMIGVACIRMAVLSVVEAEGARVPVRVFSVQVA